MSYWQRCHNRGSVKSITQALGLCLAFLLLSGSALAQTTQLEVLEETSDYRLVRHPGGETRVPLTPERIVSLHVVFNEALAALDVIPVAASFKRPNDVIDRLVALHEVSREALADLGEEERAFIPAHMPPAFAEAFDLGDGQPNLEALLAVEPDLILGHSARDAEIYEQLARIAPTVLLDFDIDPRDLVMDIGAVLGMQAQARARVAAYDACLEEASRVLDDALGDRSVAVLKVNVRELKVKGDAHRSGLVLYRHLGLTPAPFVPLGDKDAKLSFEVVPELTSEILIVAIDRRGKDEALEILASPLWQQLPSVQSGEAYLAPNSYWDEAAGLLPSERILSDLVRTFANQELTCSPRP
jgi:ABC-type Fe3+-hydroxamate transport system substrate-binding protein